MKPQGRKEIVESALTAGLCALLTGLVNWGIEAAKAKVKEREEQRKQAEKQEDEDGTATS